MSDADLKVGENLILDSSCTFQMTPNRDCFSTYEHVHKGIGSMYNNGSCKVASIEIVSIKMFDGVVRTLDDVRHVHNLKRNLISLGTLDAKGY